MNINKAIKTTGGCWWTVTSWGWTTRGPTLPASQRLFIKAMRYIEENEDETVIEALKLPHTYTGQTLPISEVITTETEWRETLDALLDAIEQETGKPFADTYVTRLFSYNFLESCASNVYDPIKTHEDHYGP